MDAPPPREPARPRERVILYRPGEAPRALEGGTRPREEPPTGADPLRARERVALALRLERTGKASAARSHLAALLDVAPDDGLAFAHWLRLTRQETPPGAEPVGLRELAGRPGAWRARAALVESTLEHGSRADAMAWSRSALDAAGPAWEEAWAAVSAALARGEAWDELAQLAEPYLAPTNAPPLRVGLLLAEAWLQLGDPEAARHVLSGLRASEDGRGEAALAALEARERRERGLAERRRRDETAEARPASRQRPSVAPRPIPASACVTLPLWRVALDGGRLELEPRPDVELVVLAPAVPAAAAHRTSAILGATLDLAEALGESGLVTPRLVLPTEPARGILLPTRAPTEAEAVRALIGGVFEGRGAAPALVLVPELVLRPRRRAQLELVLWDLDHPRPRRACLRARGNGPQLARRLAPRLGRRLRATLAPRCARARRRPRIRVRVDSFAGAQRQAALHELLEVLVAPAVPTRSGSWLAPPAWRSWWDAAPTELGPRLAAAGLAAARWRAGTPAADATRRGVLERLARGAGAEDAAALALEGRLVSLLRGLRAGPEVPVR